MESRRRGKQRNIDVPALIEKMMVDIEKLKNCKQQFDHFEGKNSFWYFELQLMTNYVEFMLCCSTKERSHERADSLSSWTIPNRMQSHNCPAPAIDESPVERIAIPTKHRKQVETAFVH